MEATATKPEIGHVSDLALFDTNLAQVRSAIAVIQTIPAPVDLAGRDRLYATLADGAKMEKVIDAARLKATEKLRARVEAMNEYAKETLLAPLKAIIADRKKEITAFDQEEEKKKQAALARIRAEQEAAARAAAEEQRKLREAAEAEAARIAAEEKAKADAAAEGLRGIARVRAQQEADARAKAAQDAAAKAAAEAESKAAIDASIAQAELRNKAEDVAATKTKGAGKVWAWEVVTPSMVPYEYLVLNPAAVTAHVRAGVRDIPGIRIFQKDSLALR